MENKNSKSKIAANNRYTQKAYEPITLRVKKGEKERIQKFAETQGMSLNGYINSLIAADMGEEQPNSDND